MVRLAPLSEEPINDDDPRQSSKLHLPWRRWLRNQFQLIPPHFHKESKLKVLLGVMSCTLSPVSLSPLPNSLPCVESQSQYILKQYEAATGCRKMREAVESVYVAGKVRMTMEEMVGPGSVSHKGCFVMWQMLPSMWLLKLVAGGLKVLAGSNGKLAWGHTLWLGAHSEKGGSRPLRRALQGLDPVIVAAMFSRAQYIGEKHKVHEDCFVLKVAADQSALAARSDGNAESIKHVTLGYFSQRSGLLVYLEDSHLTRIQSPETHTIYWETTIGSAIGDYRDVEGMKIAYSGHSTVTLTRFGDQLKVNSMITKMEEFWDIEDVVFNVPGLSLDCFIPQEEVHQEVSNTGRLDQGSPLMDR